MKEQICPRFRMELNHRRSCQSHVHMQRQTCELLASVFILHLLEILLLRKKKTNAQLEELVRSQQNLWPTVRLGKFRRGLKKAVLIGALLDTHNGFTVTSTTDATPSTTKLSSSKTRGGRPTTFQKENAVRSAVENGTMKEVPLATQLKNLGLKIAIPSVSNKLMSLHLRIINLLNFTSGRAHQAAN